MDMNKGGMTDGKDPEVLLDLSCYITVRACSRCLSRVLVSKKHTRHLQLKRGEVCFDPG